MIPYVNAEHVLDKCVIAQKCPHLGSTFNAHLLHMKLKLILQINSNNDSNKKRAQRPKYH